MTVIAYKAGVMAADSHSFQSGRRYPTQHPKVTKFEHGLFGTCGRSSDCVLAHEWAVSGMDYVPRFTEDKDEPMHLMWVKPDGTVWWADHRLKWSQVSAPATIGENSAADFTEGAMQAGLSADAAVALAIQHCVWVGGDVTVVRL